MMARKPYLIHNPKTDDETFNLWDRLYFISFKILFISAIEISVKSHTYQCTSIVDPLLASIQFGGFRLYSSS